MAFTNAVAAASNSYRRRVSIKASLAAQGLAVTGPIQGRTGQAVGRAVY